MPMVGKNIRLGEEPCFASAGAAADKDIKVLPVLSAIQSNTN